MFARLFIGLLVLYWLGWKLIRADLMPDVFAARGAATGGPPARCSSAGPAASTGPRRRRAARRRAQPPGAALRRLYALVLTMVAFDGIMALQPHWFSNLLGGWYFMGVVPGRAHAAGAHHDVRRQATSASTDLVSAKQRHDLGKLCFGFTVFWTYLMWAQFLVIWYGNLPEETGFVFARLWGPWFPVGARCSSGCS